MYSVLLVEDQDSTRTRLAKAIRAHPSLELVGEADCYSSALTLLTSCIPNVLLTDIHLPDGNGIDLIRHATQLGTCHSIVITVFGDEAHVVEAFEAGAEGYLLKDCGTPQIGSAVIDMLNGGAPLSPVIARYLLKYFRKIRPLSNEGEQNLPDLTKREREVLDLIAKGYSYNEIADKLYLSIHTVNSHIKHLYRKLKVGSRGAAVYQATQKGLI